MNWMLRASLLLALVVLTAIGGVFLFSGRDGGEGENPIQAPAFPIPPGVQGCRACHPEIYAQWEASYHALAWTDPQLQVPGMHFQERPDCWYCHIPDPVFVSGFGRMPTARSVRRTDGVDCIACHYTSGGMAGSVADPGAPCRPVQEARIADMGLCSGCHNQHKTHDEWATSSFHPDEDCNDCHMPMVEGEATKGKGRTTFRSHAWSGCHDLAMLRAAFHLEARLDEEGKLVVDLVNDGAGHNFPTDARFHRADLKVDVLLPSGQVVNQMEIRYKNPFRNEAGPNTQIKPGERLHYRRTLNLPPGATRGVVRVRLLYCLQPYPGKIADALVADRPVILQEIEVPFER